MFVCFCVVSDWSVIGHTDDGTWKDKPSTVRTTDFMGKDGVTHPVGMNIKVWVDFTGENVWKGLDGVSNNEGKKHYVFV